MRILVTGGKGFVGKHLITYLEKKGINCTSYDLYDGENLLNKKQLERAIKKVDVVVHLAAVGDVYQVAKDPQNALTVGIVGTQNLIEAANKYSIKKIIYISTWEVYGEPQYEPIDEKHPLNPDAPYSIAKYGGELVVRSQMNKIPWIILRLGTIYGGHMRKNSVFSIFIEKALKNEPILLQNGGMQKRQFTHIDDVSEAIYLSILSNINQQVFNIVDTHLVTIKELAKQIKKLCNSTSHIIIDKPRSNDPPSATISSVKARTILHWKSHINFTNALTSMITDYDTSQTHSKV